MDNIKLYDTVKDNQTGQRFRVTEVIGEGGNLVATLKMLDEDGKTKKGRGRKMGIEALEKGYTRIDLPEVTVRKIDDLSEEEREMVKVFGKKDKNAQNENQSLTGLSEEEIEKALEASTFGKVEPVPVDEKDISASDLKREVKKLEKANRELQRDLDVVCAECTDLKSERDALKNVPPSYAVERDRLQQEVTDLKERLARSIEEREKAIVQLESNQIDCGEFNKMIEPLKDVEPVRHGRWKTFDRTYGRTIFACSECGECTDVPTEMGEPIFGYCPNCGAKMDKENEQ